MKLANAFKNRCEGIAVDWRYRLNLQPYDRLPADQLLLAIAPDAQVLRPDQVPNLQPDRIAQLNQAADWSAGIVVNKPLRILMRPDISPARYESNLMHELAHIILKHRMVGFDPVTGLPMRDPQHEAEADYLGSCLQIPKRGLAWWTHKGYDALQVAHHFGASEAMVRFRCNMTGAAFPSST
ncbi:MAG: ImmA/IrrE family metallo-endopeptidase [bacterium]|nr:ImmA/IrrE family metallo-endopeptidase [bacterium]